MSPNKMSGVKRTFVASLLFVAGTCFLVPLSGCLGVCAEAKDLCVECGRSEEECDKQFSGADGEYCQDAVDTYHANCTELK
jgi:hypothetical protein